MFLLVVGTILTGHTQQILCERVLTAPAGQRAFNVSGLLQVRPDSLRLLGDFRAAFSVTNPVSLATRTSLGSWQATTCDTLASRTVFSSPQASSSLAQPNRHGQVLVANSLIGTPPYNDSIRVVLTLFGRNGQRRWSRVLPPAFRQESAGGVLEAPGGGFYVCGVNFLARIDSTGQLRWRRNYRFGTLLSPTYTRRGTPGPAQVWAPIRDRAQPAGRFAHQPVPFSHSYSTIQPRLLLALERSHPAAPTRWGLCSCRAS